MGGHGKHNASASMDWIPSHLANASRRAIGFQAHRVRNLNRPDGVFFILRCAQKDTALPLPV
jgi:hypothetical protein